MLARGPPQSAHGRRCAQLRCKLCVPLPWDRVCAIRCRSTHMDFVIKIVETPKFLQLDNQKLGEALPRERYSKIKGNIQIHDRAQEPHPRSAPRRLCATTPLPWDRVRLSRSTKRRKWIESSFEIRGREINSLKKSVSTRRIELVNSSRCS